MDIITGFNSNSKRMKYTILLIICFTITWSNVFTQSNDSTANSHFDKYVKEVNKEYDEFVTQLEKDFNEFLKNEKVWEEITLTNNQQITEEPESSLDLPTEDAIKSLPTIEPEPSVLNFEEAALIPENIESEIPIPASSTVLNTTPNIFPVPKKSMRITSGFGNRNHPIYKKNSFHSGLDLATPSGTKVFSTADGTVVKSGYNKGYGNYVIVKHNKTYKTVYAHLKSRNVTKNDRVKKGDIIGFVGSTGISTGPHLHYEVIKNNKKCNPKDYLHSN